MPEFRIEDNARRLIKEQFDRLKHRDTHKLDGMGLIKMHASFADKFEFRIPLHPKNLAQLIHPYQAYLCNFPENTRAHKISFDELVQVYENHIVSSVEKTTGRNLLGDELSCLSFWLLLDTDNEGVLNYE